MRDDDAGVAADIAGTIHAYEHVVRGIDAEARTQGGRAYGGIVRAGKGRLVESIARTCVELSWHLLQGSPSRMSFHRSAIAVPINEPYLNRVHPEDVRRHIREHLKEYVYRLRTDLHVHIDGDFCMGVECKAYTENAMLKRILVDFTLLRTQLPDLRCVLFQLESQLGGDFSQLTDPTFGSPATHTLLSYFDVDLHIITLLEGERGVDRPIHRAEHYTPLTEASLRGAVRAFQQLLADKV